MNDQRATPHTPSARHSQLVTQILEKLCPRLAGGGVIAYVRGPEGPHQLPDVQYLAALGLPGLLGAKMPDVIVHDPQRKWLFLVDAVTGNGPISPERRSELAELFKPVGAGLIFVTAVPDRPTMARFFLDIAWQTEVWVADEPGHMIHLDGPRLLEPATTDTEDHGVGSHAVPADRPHEAQ